MHTPPPARRTAQIAALCIILIFIAQIGDIIYLAARTHLDPLHMTLAGSIFLLSLALLWILRTLLAHESYYRSLLSDCRTLEDRLRTLAQHDPLTGLPNRAFFYEHLQRAIENAHTTTTAIAVLFLDLDGFKSINDIYGHAIGDRMLMYAGERMYACLRASDTIARLGGDEFTIMLPDIRDTASIEKVVDEILTRFKKTFRCQYDDRHLGVSIGIALYPTHGTTPDELMQAADRAMYHAKRAGKHCAVWAKGGQEEDKKNGIKVILGCYHRPFSRK